MMREEFTKSSLPDARDGVVGARCRVLDRPDETCAYRSMVEPPFEKFLRYVMQVRRTAGTP
jgi:hypothetical protein